MPLPTTAAAGPLTLAEGYLAATLCASARFQTMLGVASSALALARCYIDALPLPTAVAGNTPDQYTAAELATLRPFCLISTPPRSSYRRRRVATDTYAESGLLSAWIELTVSSGDRLNLAETFRVFKNHIGVIATELDAISYGATYLAIDEIQVDGPWRCEEDEVNQVGDHMGIMLTLKWNGGLEQ